MKEKRLVYPGMEFDSPDDELFVDRLNGFQRSALCEKLIRVGLRMKNVRQQSETLSPDPHGEICK